ncbi:MAG: hypothetical protein P8188_01240 [Gemmatimonadota bacterium]|jgi:hypothetical protein
MSAQRNPRFLVLDAMDGPHGGQILRLRLESGEPPSIRSLKGAQLTAVGPEGGQASLKVTGFPLFGGRPSDSRLGRTGRVDVAVEPVKAGSSPVGLQWEVSLES